MKNKTLTESILELPHCKKELKDKFIQQFNPLEFQKNQILISPNINDQSVYFIQSGLLRTFYKAANQTITRTIHIPGDYLIQNGTFIMQPALEYVDCLEETHLYSINFRQLERFIIQFPESIKLLLSIIETKNLKELQHTNLQHFSAAMDRYHYANELLGKNIQNIPRQILASYLNLSRKHLGRLAAASAHLRMK